jgi:hypothetical protein
LSVGTAHALSLLSWRVVVKRRRGHLK